MSTFLKNSACARARERSVGNGGRGAGDDAAGPLVVRVEGRDHGGRLGDDVAVEGAADEHGEDRVGPLVVAVGEDVAVADRGDRRDGPVEADEVLAPRRPVLGLAAGHGLPIALEGAFLVDVADEVALAGELHRARHVVRQKGHDDRELEDLDRHAAVDAVDRVRQPLVEVVVAEAEVAEFEDLEGLCRRPTARRR